MPFLSFLLFLEELWSNAVRRWCMCVIYSVKIIVELVLYA
ncbi:hypothetical protein GYH30_018177 [Glycine max]|nr:hypothetical protein GYH30_018177 [Glycine max]